MIRSLGSSLLAKAGTGSLSRKKDETRITTPEIPGKAATGTAVRDLTQETDIQPVAPGSEKVIRSAPGIESASLPGMAANQVPLVAGMGTPGGVPAAPEVGQPMLRSEGGAASQAGQAGRQATIASTTGAPIGAVAKAKAAEQARSLGEQTNIQGGRVSFNESSLPDIGIFGSRVSAGGGEEVSSPAGQWQPTTGQYLSGAIGKAIDTVGKKLGNILPNLNISENLQKYGGSQTVATAGKGSVGKAVQNISGALRSVVNEVKNTFSNLRSKLGR